MHWIMFRRDALCVASEILYLYQMKKHTGQTEYTKDSD